MSGVFDVPFSDYLAMPGWGSGSLRAMRRGPPLRVMWERQNPRGDTDASLLGRLVHCSVLTPALFDTEFVCKPEDMSFATKEGKAWRAEQEALIVPHHLFSTACDITTAVMDKVTVRDTLEAASHREVSLIWDCPISREACKGRPDWICGHYVYDLKISRYADGPALGRRAYWEGWMHQLAHYRTGSQALGLDVRGGRLVVASPVPPHLVYTIEVKTDALDLLEIENIETLKAMRECRLANDWPGTPDSWTKVEPPVSEIAEFGDVVLEHVDTEIHEEAMSNG